jgi:hypothetical protein
VAWQWLSARVGTLPLVLAGPILRCVEPGMVCVWVATQAAQNITLTVQAAGAAASTLAATNVTTELPNGEPTVQLGENLFVALLTANAPASAQLQPGVLYYYELTFTPAGGGASTTFASAMSAPGTANPDLKSIVYTDQTSSVMLPSFSLPPKTLSAVRLAHTSCRKAGGENADALPLLDKLIAGARTGSSDEQFAASRLHQLFLTGDQIYADDVADSYLGMCIDAAGWLMGTRQEPAPAYLGILGPNPSGNHPFPTQATPGWDILPYRPLGSTPWDTTKWPGVGVRGKLVSAAGLTAVAPDTDKLTPVAGYMPVGRELQKYYLTRNHLMALGEFYAALLLAWSPVLWCPGDAADKPLSLPYDAQAMKAYPNPDPNTDPASNADPDAPAVALFGAGVAAVRRVLANVPTYMICDDHDMSDDWYMNRLWCQRVLNLKGDTLGRRMVRNALIAYAIFQAWGNTPEQFGTSVTSTLGGQLLTLLAGGKEMTDDLNPPPAADGSPAIGEVSVLVGVPQALAATSPALTRQGQSLTWHYRWGPAGWQHEVIVLDCRTLRRYAGGPIDPPQLLDDGTAPSGNPDQFDAQLGTRATSDVVTLVVVQTPVLGVRWVEDLFQHKTRVKPVFEKDAEAWSLSPNGYELMLGRLAEHNPNGVILLSGDVHYSFAASADYYATTPWGRTDTLTPARTVRIVQLNSSAARNETWMTRDFLHVTGFSALVGMPDPETWAGFRTRPSYLESGLANYAGPGKSGTGATALNRAPVVLNVAAYLAALGGEVPVPEPDWKYRIQFASGTRDNPPAFSKPPSLSTLPPSLAAELAAAGLSLASLAQHIRAVAGSEIVGKNNVCVVTFSGADNKSWQVQQAVYWRPDQSAIRLDSTDPLRFTPVSLTTQADVTRFGIPLQYGPDPQVN